MSKVLHRNVHSLPPLAVRSQGSSVTLKDGRQVIDACGGAAVSCLGHDGRRVADAITRQCQLLPYVHSSFFRNEPAEQLAQLLVNDEQHFSRAVFVSSGSEAMEFAMKLVRQYFVETGHPERTEYIARHLSYHGNTLGALALGGHASRREIYEPMLVGPWHHVSPCFPYHYQRPDETLAEYGARLVVELDMEFQRIGPERVAAVCLEPMVGATAGCVAAVDGYLSGVREVCGRHGALLVFDEVMCGMGRTGFQHAWQADGVSPDLQVVAKGLGGGFQAIGGVLISERVLEGISAGAGAVRGGHTYQNHPIACAAALEVQRIIQEQDLLKNVREVGEYLGGVMQGQLGARPYVGEIRGRGLFWALEVVMDQSTRVPFPVEHRICHRLQSAALAHGLAVYPGSGTVDGWRGDHVLIAPPFNVSHGDIDEIVGRLEIALESLEPVLDAAALAGRLHAVDCPSPVA